jgi:hypothetical protein
MCVVSMITDHYIDKWSQRCPNCQPSTTGPYTGSGQIGGTWPISYPDGVPEVTPNPGISQAELEEFRQLLERAREYDRRNNEPDCELDSKRQALKNIAKQLGVEIAFL